MKKRLALVLSLLLLFCAVTMVACGGKDDDGENNPPAVTKAAYKTEYWLEDDNGAYVKNDTYGETLTAEVDSTVKIEQKTITGYVFESDHKSNVMRGKVLADGSLVLKAYYSKDYTGRVTFETELTDSIDLLKDNQTKLDVIVKVDGEAVSDGVAYASGSKYVSIDPNGMMNPRMRGEADISVSYKNVSKTFHATVYDKFIENEEDFWSIYDSLSYWYKFKNDITLSENTLAHFADPSATDKPTQEGYGINKDFHGVLDGGGYSLNYKDARLFHWVYGTGTVIRNITLNAKDGFYWGATIAYGMDQNALVENVTLNVSNYKNFECNHFVGGDWIHAGEGNIFGNGSLFATVANATIKDCTVNVDLTTYAQNIEHYGGIAYLASSGAVIENCTVISTDDSIKIVSINSGATITNSTVQPMEETTYAVEYYLDDGTGNFVKNDDLTETNNSYVGLKVSAEAKSIAGFAFDPDNENNVLTGKVAANGALALKLYYNKSNVVFDTQTPDEFELVGTATKELAVSVTDDGNPVTSGVSYVSSDNSIVTVSDSGVVTAVKGGKATVTVKYAGATKDFTVTVYTKLITSETDWWSMYDSETALAGWYKLSGNLALSQSSVEHFTDGHTVNHTFTGLINGDGHTLDYTGAGNNRLFHSLTGTIENLTYNAGSGFYWGSVIAYHITGATLKNLNITANFIHATVKQVSGSWITAQGAGVLGVYLDGTTVENCNITASFSRAADTFAPYVYFNGIGYEVKNSTVKNVTVNCDDPIKLYELSSNNTESEAKVVSPEINWIEIDSEEDWWAIYRDQTSLAGNYKFVKDITLTKSSVEVVENGVQNESGLKFTGRIDGNGYKLIYAGSDGQGAGNNRLFYEFQGVMENLTYEAGSGFYWGSAIAFTLRGAILNNVTVNATMTTADIRQFAGGIGDGEGGMYGFAAAWGGAICVYMESSCMRNCTVNVELADKATANYYAGIAGECNKSLIIGVTVNSKSQLTSSDTTGWSDEMKNGNGLFKSTQNWNNINYTVVNKIEE